MEQAKIGVAHGIPSGHPRAKSWEKAYLFGSGVEDFLKRADRGFASSHASVRAEAARPAKSRASPAS